MGSTSNDNRKVNVIKMSCLPKMNYLLQSPPIPIPLSYLKQADRICKAFIWNSKRLWMLSNKLQRPAEKGSLGLPNVLLCFYAFDLSLICLFLLKNLSLGMRFQYCRVCPLN